MKSASEIHSLFQMNVITVNVVVGSNEINVNWQVSTS